MEQEYVINHISDRLNQLSDRLKSREHSATVLEGVCHKLFDALFGWNLNNLNQEHYSFAAVDLGDKAQRVAIQITVQDGSGKATHTLRQIDSAGHRQHYNLFICFFLVPKAPGCQTADPPDFHRWGIRDLIECILKPLHVPEWLKPFVPSTHHSINVAVLQKALVVLEETLADRRFAPLPPKRLAYHLHPDAHAGFIGRKEVLKELRTALKLVKYNVSQQAMAVHADGGVGKTSLAIHLGADLFAKETFDYVLFLAATTPDAMRGDLTALCTAQYLNLPAQEAREAQKQYEEVLSFLSKPDVSRRTLLIVDGADDGESRAAVSNLRGELPGCAFLITSRHADWGKGVNAFPLELFTDAEARDFLRDRLEKIAATSAQLLDTIARELGHLPLALEIAASYIRRQRLRPQDWLQEWQNAPEPTYGHHCKDHLHYPLPLGRVWDQSFARLGESARKLLHCLAFIAPRPAALPLEPFEKLPEWPTLRQELITLADASLIQWDNTEKSLLIHRLLQTCIRLNLALAKQRAALSSVLASMPKTLPDPDFDAEGWKLWIKLQPHLDCVLGALDDKTITPRQSEELGFTLNRYGRWLFNHAQYSLAEPHYLRALRLAETTFGSNHPNVASILNNIAQLLQATNRPFEAEPLYRRALYIDELNYGQEHPEAATVLNNLAQVMHATNRLFEAEEPMRRVLSIYERNHGPNHPNVAVALNNLAMLLKATNRYFEAECCMRRALAIDQACFGSNHPSVATALNNLATLLQATNHHAEAEYCLRGALRIDEDSFGPDHPNVARDLNNLGLLLKAAQRFTEAEELIRKALNINESNFGLNDPKVAVHLNNLAQVFLATNRLTDAEELFCRALRIDEDSFGPDHPRIATRLNNLAILLSISNRFAETVEPMRRMMFIFAQFTAQTGYEHPHLRSACRNYISLEQRLVQPVHEARRRLRCTLAEGGMTPDQIEQVLQS